MSDNTVDLELGSADAARYFFATACPPLGAVCTLFSGENGKIVYVNRLLRIVRFEGSSAEYPWANIAELHWRYPE